MTASNELTAYRGGPKRVIVYDTYAEGRKIHFDVFVPTAANNIHAVDKEVDVLARQCAEEFLKLIGKSAEGLTVSMCERCHVDDTSVYGDRLFQLPGREIYILPMEGCPKPNPG